MLSQRTGLAALAFTTALASGALMMDEASAKGRCGTGQILKVSSGTCISRASAVQQGIIGGKHKATKEAATKKARTAKVEPEDDDEEDDAPETTSVARTEPKTADAPKTDAPTTMASAATSAVRIQVVKTEPRPAPDILMPTWPYGELPAFPRRTTP